MEKLRVLVMNGQRIIQNNKNNNWANVQVDKAGQIKPGIYNLTSAKEADKTKIYDGAILLIDAKKIYQVISSTSLIQHDKSNFIKLPEVGLIQSISYDQKSGRAVVSNSVGKSRGITR